MCVETKRRIADCTKRLMRKKPIARITIQDIMDETQMSRQSFYYHFKDIYDVLEWIAGKDILEPLACCCQDMETWSVQLRELLKKEQLFCVKAVQEIEWPRILGCIRIPVEAQLQKLGILWGEPASGEEQRLFEVAAEFVTDSFCYCLMGYLYERKEIPRELLSWENTQIRTAFNGNYVKQSFR